MTQRTLEALAQLPGAQCRAPRTGVGLPTGPVPDRKAKGMDGAKSASFGHKNISVQTLARSLDKSLLSETRVLLLWEGQNDALGPFCQPRVCPCA